jgi:hypothetical protein
MIDRRVHAAVRRSGVPRSEAVFGVPGSAIVDRFDPLYCAARLMVISAALHSTLHPNQGHVTRACCARD